MGYYNDVVMVANGNIDALLTRFATERTDHFARTEYLFNWGNDKHAPIEVRADRLLMRLEGVRWYSPESLELTHALFAKVFNGQTDPIVVALEALWSLIEEDDGRRDPSALSAAFVRVGEDSGDIEERYVNDGWGLVSVSRSIVLNDSEASL